MPQIACSCCSGPARITGYQVKRGKNKVSKKDTSDPFKNFDWLEEIFWIQGKLSEHGNDTYEKVTILNEMELKQLLGYSLESFLPNMLDALSQPHESSKRRTKGEARDIENEAPGVE